MSKITQAELVSAIEKALELQAGTVTENTAATEIESWDSLGQLSILVALDKLCDGKIANIAGMAEADSVGKILALLRQHSVL